VAKPNMDEKKSAEVIARYNANEAELARALEVQRVKREREMAATRKAQASTRHQREMAEAGSVVGALEAVVATLSKLSPDALYRSTDEEGMRVSLGATKALARARRRLALLEQD
jgi:hypothetical protein